jgi:DNA-binding Xre family transcriptional regulator
VICEPACFRRDMSKIKLNVKEAAEGRGISNPRELHLKSGVTYSVCYRMWYEANQNRLDLTVLARLCDALECAPSDLLVLSETPARKRRK